MDRAVADRTFVLEGAQGEMTRPIQERVEQANAKIVDISKKEVAGMKRWGFESKRLQSSLIAKRHNGIDLHRTPRGHKVGQCRDSSQRQHGQGERGRVHRLDAV